MKASDLFIIEEVKRQDWDVETSEGAARVHWMRYAWMYAEKAAEGRSRPTVDDILELAYMVEPVVNRNGYRKFPVFVMHRSVMAWNLVPSAMERLWHYGRDLSPLRFYFEFEAIHPLADGNGRVGAILYNWMRGTLAEPETPEDVFADRAEEAFRKFPYLAPRVWGTAERHAAMNYPIQGYDHGLDEDCLDDRGEVECRETEAHRQLVAVGYIIEPDEEPCREHEECDMEPCSYRVTGGEMVRPVGDAAREKE